PKLVGWDEIGARLASLYLEAGDWEQASAIGTSVAGRSDVPGTAGASRWVVAQSAFAHGDLGALLDNARQITIRSPRASQAADAIEIVRAMTATPETAPLKLTDAERLERAVALMRDGDPEHALEE